MNMVPERREGSRADSAAPLLRTWRGEVMNSNKGDGTVGFREISGRI